MDLNAAQQAGFSFAQANHLVDNALADDGFSNAADGDVATMGCDFDLDLESDVVIEMDRWGHLDLHADILILELRVDERTDHRCSRAGLVRTGGDWDARADLHAGFLVVGRTNTRALQHLGIRV